MAEVKNICIEALERHCERGETGRLDFHRGNYNGQIFIEDRLIVHAQLAALEGVPALFRLFDWGDAETTWQSGEKAEKPSLHLAMPVAIEFYGEQLHARAALEAKEQERFDEALNAPELLTGNGIESVLKYYNISLECTDKTVMPEGFMLSDVNKNSYVIGSSEDCDVVLRHHTVDPLHCGMILERGTVQVWDLGASAGVKLNGARIAQDILKVGDLMTLGALDLQVRFLLRRPNIARKAPPEPTEQTSTMPMPKIEPHKHLPKGAITYDKVTRQLKDTGQAKPFLQKLGSLFGGKKK